MQSSDEKLCFTKLGKKFSGAYRNFRLLLKDISLYCEIDNSELIVSLMQ